MQGGREDWLDSRERNEGSGSEKSREARMASARKRWSSRLRLGVLAPSLPFSREISLEWQCNAVGRHVINASCRWYRVVDDPRDDR